MKGDKLFKKTIDQIKIKLNELEENNIEVRPPGPELEHHVEDNVSS